MSATSPVQASDSFEGAQAVDGEDTQTVDVDGGTVVYAEFGDSDGEPLVFLHGTPGSRLLGALYDDAARERNVRVLAFDRPGYGQSSARPEYSATDTADVLTAVLDDAGVERAGLVAFSGGTPHALAAAAELGSRVRGVDVVSGAVPPSFRDETPTPQRVLGALAGSTPRLLSGLLRGQTWLARRLSPSFVVSQYTTEEGREALSDDVARLVKRDFVEALARSRSGVVQEFQRASDGWPLSPSTVDCEVRWWHGNQDENVPLPGARQVVDALPNGSLHVFEGADHLGALLESREDVLARYAPGE